MAEQVPFGEFEAQLFAELTQGGGQGSLAVFHSAARQRPLTGMGLEPDRPSGEEHGRPTRCARHAARQGGGVGARDGTQSVGRGRMGVMGVGLGVTVDHHDRDRGMAPPVERDG